MALYVGGMGAKGKNFYNDVVCRYGFEKEAEAIQELYLDGQEEGGRPPWCPTSCWRPPPCAVPSRYVAERIAAYADAGVTHLQVTPIPVGDQRPVDLIATVKELAG